MAMERVTVEQNGERFTLEVPEGTTDAEIQSFLANQPGSARDQLTTTEPSLAEPIQGMAAGAAAKAAFGSPETRVTSLAGPVKPTLVSPGPIPKVAGEVADLAKIASKVTPAGATDVFKKPLQFLGALPGAIAERYVGSANMNKSFGEMARGAGQALINPANIKNVATGVGAMAMAPENLLAAPYQMAAYEQAKIRANPTAPEYATNPYAQMTRGEAATQGQAGAMNRRNALINQQYGGLTPEQQQILQQDQMRQQEIQKKKIRAQQVLQQPPTAQNFIERMVAMGDLYGTVNQG